MSEPTPKRHTCGAKHAPVAAHASDSTLQSRSLYAHPFPADEVNGSHRKRRLLSLPSTTAEPHREALLLITALAPNVHLPTEQSVRTSAAVYRSGAALARPAQDQGNTTAPGKPVRRLPSRLTNPTPGPAQLPKLSLAEVCSVWPFAGVVDVCAHLPCNP